MVDKLVDKFQRQCFRNANGKKLASNGKGEHTANSLFSMVRATGFEPARCDPIDPKDKVKG